MSVALTLQGVIKVVEELAASGAPAAAAANRRITHDQFNASHSLTAATTPPVTQAAAFTHTCNGSAQQIDLTALTGSNGATVSGSGLKIQAIMIKHATGTHATTIVPGTNAYNLLGAAFSVILMPGQWLLFFGNDATPDVADGSADNIQVTGTTGETLQILVVMG